MQLKTLVFGASLNPDRISNLAIRRLLKMGVEVVAFGRREGMVGPIKIDTKLQRYEEVHTVSLYVNPEVQKTYYDYLISLNPQRVIFNPGTENPEFYELLQEAGIKAEVSCTLTLLATNQYQAEEGDQAIEGQ